MESTVTTSKGYASKFFHPPFLSTPKGSQECKLFIGGLHLQTTTESLKEFYGKWGSIVDAVVMRDPATKRSRGFGFVTYDTVQAVDECLANRPHVVDGKEVEAKRAVPREENNPVAHTKTKKIFLGGLSHETSEEDIREVLEQYGAVQDITIMRDKNTNRPRGFGFAIYEDYDVVDKVCIKKFLKIKDREVEVKKAESQEEIRKREVDKTGYYGGSGGSGGGRERGGYDRESSAAYSSSPYQRPMPQYDYRQMGGYDYSRYSAAADYMRDPYGLSSGYNMAAAAYGGDRSTAAAASYAAAYPTAYRTGYDMASAYGGVYGNMGSYAQTSSSYGPAKGYGSRMASSGGGGSRDRERAPPTRSYHPYQR